MKSYRIERTGQNVEQLLDKIDDLGEATVVKPGMMAADDKRKLDQVELDEAISIDKLNRILN